MGAFERWYWRQALGSLGPNLARRALHLVNGFARRERVSRTMAQDVGYALKSVRKNAAFSAVLVLTLSLGIGANATIFSAVYGLVLRPFPFPEPDRIVGVGTAYPKLGVPLGYLENASPAEFVDVRDQSRTLEEVGREFNVTRERIRQIEMKALKKLKHSTRRRQFVGLIEFCDMYSNTAN